MNIEVFYKSNRQGFFGRITTDHSASSYGIPVLVDLKNNVVDNFDPLSVVRKGGSTIAPSKWFDEGFGDELKSTKTPHDLLVLVSQFQE